MISVPASYAESMPSLSPIPCRVYRWIFFSDILLVETLQFYLRTTLGGGGKVIERDDARVRQCLRHFQRVLKCTGFCGAFVTVGGVSLTFYSAKDPLSAFSSVRLCVTLFSGYWNSCMDSVLKWLCVI